MNMDKILIQVPVIVDRTPDTNNSHWYSLPTDKTVNTTSSRDFYQNYDARQTFSSSGNSEQKQNGRFLLII
jgi:hypothetical protein